MRGGPSLVNFRWRFLLRSWPWLFLAGFLFFVRWSKGAVFSDVFALISRPFWPGTAQRVWLQNADQLEQESKLHLLERDNARLRTMLGLQASSKSDLVSVPVISRNPRGWWQQLQLGKGSLDGIQQGCAVVAPGGLVGIINSVTPKTSRVRLLTSPGTRIGVWVTRVERHGILLGMGTNRPQLTFLDKDPQVVVGDLLSTSPASTLLPPNLPVGVIQSLDTEALPAPNASIQLLAAPEAIDWVQVQKCKWLESSK